MLRTLRRLAPHLLAPQLLVLLATIPCVLAGGTLSAQPPRGTGTSTVKGGTDLPEATDLYTSLRDAINYGAELFNKQADHAGCYRVYQGALITARPYVAVDLRKRIDDTIVRAEALPYYSERAFEARRMLDEIRTKIGPGKTSAPIASPPASAPPVVNAPANSPPTTPKSPSVGIPNSPRAGSGPKTDLPKIVDAPHNDGLSGAPKVEVFDTKPSTPEPGKVDSPKGNVPKVEVPTPGAPKIESPPKIASPPAIDLKKTAAPKGDLPPIKPAVTDPKKADPPKIEIPGVNPPTVDPKKADPPKIEIPGVNPPAVDPKKADLPKIEIPDVKPPTVDPKKADLPKIELPKIEGPKSDPKKADLPKIDSPKIESPKNDLPKIELPRLDPAPAAPKDPAPIPIPPIDSAKEKKTDTAKSDPLAIPKIEIPVLNLPGVDPKGKPDAPAKDKGEVAGTVFLDGKSLAAGLVVTLVSAEGKRFSSLVENNGRFRFAAGLPLGNYRVVIEPLPGSTDAAAVPARYRDEATSGLTLQVNAGKVTPELRLTR
jgi:hypothetical protein